MIEYLLLNPEQIAILKNHVKSELLLKDIIFSPSGNNFFVSGYKFRISKIKKVLNGKNVRFK